MKMEYAGDVYEDRTDAKWASFLRSMEIPFVYAHSAQHNGYLPTFWLPTLDRWLEVSILRTDPLRAEGLWSVAKQLNKVIVSFDYCRPAEIVRTHVSGSSDDFEFRGWGIYYDPMRDHEGMIAFGYCDICKSPTLGHMGGHQMFCKDKSQEYIGTCQGTNNPSSHEKILSAFKRAGENNMTFKALMRMEKK